MASNDPPGMTHVLWSCKACGVRNARLLLRVRKPGESLQTWTLAIREVIRDVHGVRSPDCASPKVTISVQSKDHQDSK